MRGCFGTPNYASTFWRVFFFLTAGTNKMSANKKQQRKDKTKAITTALDSSVTNKVSDSKASTAAVSGDDVTREKESELFRAGRIYER